jgi:MFS superfamily sulfate permease-like transporter
MPIDPVTAKSTPPRALLDSRDQVADWRREISGAFGDLGTLVPYIVAYLVVVGMDAGIVFLSFGVALLATGLYYRLPVPVQPMKAIGAAAAAHASQQLVVTPSALALSAVITGVFWLVASHSGLAQWAGNAVPRNVAKGIIMGVGVSLLIEALRQIQVDWLLGVPMLVALLALNNRARVSPFLLIVLAGILVGAWRHPELIVRLREAPVGFALPRWVAPDWTSSQLWLVAVLLALPQIPLTFGNAVVGLVEETRRVFPGSEPDEGRVAKSTGWMNVWAGLIGGPPMCHGSGGLAGYLASGARTGWAVATLGVLFIVAALFFQASIVAALSLIPAAAIGAMLFVVGLYMVIGTAGSNRDKAERAVLLGTAAVTIWNVGAGLVAGIVLHHGLKRRWFLL